MSFRWLKRVATSLALLGLAVAIVVLLFPGEHGQKNHFVKGKNTAGTFVSSKEGSYARNSTVVPQGLSWESNVIR